MDAQVVLTKVTENADQSVLKLGVKIAPSDKLAVSSKLRNALEYLALLDGTKIDAVAVESAAFSGVFYALRKIDDSKHVNNAKYTVDIEYITGKIPSANLSVCAIAAFIAVAYATNNTGAVVDCDLQGWQVKEVTTS